jgi:hypothetical protein
MSLADELGVGVAGEPVGRFPSPDADLPLVTHAFSHLKARYWPFVFVMGPSAGTRSDMDAGRWVPLGELDQVALPVAQRKIAESLLESLSS